MIVFIILCILLSIGIYFLNLDSYKYDFGITGFIITMIAVLGLILHLCSWLPVSYKYNQFVIQRQAFVNTLQEARKNNNPIELAAITQNIVEWNQALAEAKYDNTIFILQDYVDDRIDNLKPIK